MILKFKSNRKCPVLVNKLFSMTCANCLSHMQIVRKDILSILLTCLHRHLCNILYSYQLVNIKDFEKHDIFLSGIFRAVCYQPRKKVCLVKKSRQKQPIQINCWSLGFFPHPAAVCTCFGPIQLWRTKEFEVVLPASRWTKLARQTSPCGEAECPVGHINFNPTTKFC